MPAPIVNEVKFYIDFKNAEQTAPGSEYEDVSADVYEYSIDAGTTWRPGTHTLALDGTRGRIRLFNRARRYDRRASADFTESELSTAHRMRMRVDGQTVVWAMVAPPRHEDSSTREYADFDVYSPNAAIYNQSFERRFNDSQNASSLLGYILQDAGLYRHPDSVIPAVNVAGDFDVRMTYGYALRQFGDFVGAYVLETGDQQILVISRSDTLTRTPITLDNGFMDIKVDGYRDATDVAGIRNRAVMTFPGDPDGTQTTSTLNTTVVVVRIFEVSINSGNEVWQNVSASVDASYDSAQNWVFKAVGWLAGSPGTNFSNQVETEVVSTSGRTAQLRWRLKSNTSLDFTASSKPYHPRLIIETNARWTVTVPNQPTDLAEATIENSASIAKYGARDLTLPPWFTAADVNSPTGSRAQTNLDKLAEPVTYRTLVIPMAQRYQLMTDRLRDLRVGDLCYVNIRIDEEQLAHHRMFLLGIRYEGGSNMLDEMKLHLVDLNQHVVAGQFFLDQSELDGDDTLG